MRASRLTYARPMADVSAAAATAQVIEATLKDAGLEWESPESGSYVVKLPGTRKLSTTCSLIVGAHSLSLNAFVIRHPDENDAAVHRWLLERNLRLFGVSYAIDRLGDIYLVGRLPLSVVTPRSWTGCSASSSKPPTALSTHCWSWASRARSVRSTRGGCRAASPRGIWTRSRI